MTKTKINAWLINATKRLADQSEFPFLETQVLLSHVMNKPREWLLSHPEEILPDPQVEEVNQQLTRLLSGVPLPYITGKQAFFGLDFMVSPDVLIPRPETEQLVEECIQWLEDHPAKRKMVDVGTGSGAIAITLADHFDDLEVTAIDLSNQALEIARKNALQYQVNQRITFIQSNLLDHCESHFDLIAANLPYIPRETLLKLPVAKHEPLLALDGGEDGLKLITQLLSQCEDHLRPGGLIILEIEATQGNSLLNMANSLLPHAKTTLLFDLAKLPRIIKIQV